MTRDERLMREKSAAWLEAECLRWCRLLVLSRHLKAVKIERIKPAGTGPNWQLAPFKPDLDGICVSRGAGGHRPPPGDLCPRKRTGRLARYLGTVEGPRRPRAIAAHGRSKCHTQPGMHGYDLHGDCLKALGNEDERTNQLPRRQRETHIGSV
jgi:hypothetical protein